MEDHQKFDSTIQADNMNDWESETLYWEVYYRDFSWKMGSNISKLEEIYRIRRVETTFSALSVCPSLSRSTSTNGDNARIIKELKNQVP